MSTFILLSAIPGAGKSTWAKLYAKEHQGVHIVSSDDVRKAVTGNQQNFSQEPLVWKTFLDTINGFAKNEPSCTVIADSTNLNNKYRLYYRDMTPDFTHHILVVFDIPYDIALQQNQMRPKEKIVPLAAMERLHNEFEPPTEEVIRRYDEYHIIGPSFVSKKIADADPKKS
jgi:predicted kinase